MGYKGLGYTRRTFMQVSVGLAASALAAPAVRAQSALRVGLIPSEDSRAMLAASRRRCGAATCRRI